MTTGISCRLYFSVLHTDLLLRNFNGFFNDFWIVNSPNVNSLFYSFTESPSAGTWGETLKAFVFSLKNSEDLPPFKCFVKNQYRTVYKSSSYGQSMENSKLPIDTVTKELRQGPFYINSTVFLLKSKTTRTS